MSCQMHKGTIFGEKILRSAVQSDPWKLCMLIEMPPPIIKELQSFLGIMNYQRKFSPSTAQACEPLQRCVNGE